MSNTVKAKRPINPNSDDSDDGGSDTSFPSAGSPTSIKPPPKKKRQIQLSNSDREDNGDDSDTESTLDKPTEAASHDQHQPQNGNKQRTIEKDDQDNLDPINGSNPTTTTTTSEQTSPRHFDETEATISHSKHGGDSDKNEQIGGGDSEAVTQESTDTPTAKASNNQQSHSKQKQQPLTMQQQQRQQQQQQQQDVRKPRLVITKMVLNDFKSYAGRQVIGPFHKSFSAVVGPNGSGKSNVIDALLFVFGYRANKMRQGKLSELIHNSAKYPNIKSCSVEIHFQEIIDGDTPDKFEVIPNSRLVVSRQASRNNSSKYYINEAPSSYVEVTDLLRGRGIDLDHKRFLILQGEVESIALMKPKAKDDHDDGLLEYLEDIIGTSKYKESILKASERLEECNVIRAEKLNRVNFVVKEMENLEDKKLEAENYLENENELSKRKNELYQIYRYEANVNMDVAGKVVDELKEKLRADEEEHAHIENEIAAGKEAYQKEVKEYNFLEAEYAKIMKRQAKCEKDQVELKAKKDQLQNRREKSKESIESDRKALAKAEESIKKNTQEIEKRQKDLVTSEKQLKAEEKKLDQMNVELQGRTAGYMAEIEKHQAKLAPWTEKCVEKKKAIDIKNSESDILKDRISSGAKAVEEAERQISKLVATKKKKLLELESLPMEINELRAEVDELTVKVKNVTDRETSCRKELSTIRQKTDEARASLQKSQSRGKVLDGLLRMRDSGRIKGIYDRMGNLGVIDDKYDVAISTACPALHNIVVETVEAGQECIEYLRKNNLGRAVFTILDKLQRKNMDPIETPDGVPRLFDLVKPRDDKFAPAFYSVLKDTLVAKDLQEANRIAFGRKRWRVVTMDGKLIEKSGAMTGGGNKQSRGAMSARFKNDDVNPEMVASLEKECNDLETEHRNLSEEKRALELVLRTKQGSLPKKELTLEKLQMDSRSLDAQLEDDTHRLDELKAQATPSPQDVQRLEDIKIEVEQLHTEIKELEETMLSIQTEIDSLQEEILDVGGMDLRLQKIVVDDVRQRIDTHNDKITKCSVHKTKAEKDVVKLGASMEKTDQDMETMIHDSAELDRQLIAVATTLASIQGEIDEVKKNKDAKKEVMNEMKTELDAKTADINEFRQAKVEINIKLSDYQKTFTENKRKAEHWSEQQSKLTMHKLWNEKAGDSVLQIYDDEKVKELQQDKQLINGEIAEIEAFVQNAKPNLSVLEEYRRRDEEYQERATDLNDVTKNRDQAKSEVDSLRKRRLDEFMQGFNIISQKLKEMYQMITLGGNAELELVDSLDPFSEGIVFSVMPPKKSWKNISNLSGGEKTLSSLALVFALHHFKPTPLYVMDEIDAALDFRNVSIVANYIAEQTKNAQFVIISLRNNMFELADRLVGIYKTSDCTKSVAINPSMVAILSGLNNDDEQRQKQQRQNQQSQLLPKQQESRLTPSSTPVPSSLPNPSSTASSSTLVP